MADLLHASGRSDESMWHLKRAVEIFAEVGDVGAVGAPARDLASSSGGDPNRRVSAVWRACGQEARPIMRSVCSRSRSRLLCLGVGALPTAADSAGLRGLQLVRWT